MNNNIEEDYCSYQVSKLLEQKGLRLKNPTIAYMERDEYDLKNPIKSIVKKDNILTCDVKIPSHTYAVKWIRTNFGLHIHAPFPLNNGKWEWIIFDLNSPQNDNDSFKNIMSLNYEPYYFNSPEECIDNAILYLLTKIL